MFFKILQNNNDRFTINPTAEVEIINADFLEQGMPDSGKTAVVSMKAMCDS